VTRVSRETAVAADGADLRQALALVPEIAPFVEPLEEFVRLLDRWRKVTNLVADASFAHVWTRHIADSAQLLTLAQALDPAPAPGGVFRWLDLGTGAGFPGLIVAILLRDTPNAEVHCVEADKRKCAFLREAARAVGAKVAIHAGRIEDLPPRPFDIVTARALAPLDRLLGLAEPFLAPGTRCLFLKGERAAEELTRARKGWKMAAAVHSSRSDPRGVILELQQVAREPRDF